MSTISKTGGKSNSTTENFMDYVDSVFRPVGKLFDAKLDKAGGVVTGDINMNNNRITNVKHPPESNADVITKEYCDSFGEKNSVLMVVQ